MVTFEPDEIELAHEAQVILLTGWTHEQYLDAPMAITDAIIQKHIANVEIEAAFKKQAYDRARRGK